MSNRNRVDLVTAPALLATLPDSAHNSPADLLELDRLQFSERMDEKWKNLWNVFGLFPLLSDKRRDKRIKKSVSDALMGK